MKNSSRKKWTDRNELFIKIRPSRVDRFNLNRSTANWTLSAKMMRCKLVQSKHRPTANKPLILNRKQNHVLQSSADLLTLVSRIMRFMVIECKFIVQHRHNLYHTHYPQLWNQHASVHICANFRAQFFLPWFDLINLLTIGTAIRVSKIMMVFFCLKKNETDHLLKSRTMHHVVLSNGMNN